MSRRRASSYALFALGLLGTFGACRSSKDGDGMPGDFCVFAQFGSGESDWIPWTLTIEPDGRATLAYENDELRKVESIRTLSRADLRDLHARVIDSDFAHLSRRYAAPGTDAETLVLKVTRNGQTHEVAVFGASDVGDRSAVRRFLKVWAEVLRKVPPPNKDQTPELYEKDPVREP
jgi:hypothetical protein